MRFNLLNSANRSRNLVLRDCQRFLKERWAKADSFGILLCFPLKEPYLQIACRVFMPLLQAKPERVLIIIPENSRQLLSFVKDDKIVGITEPADIRKEPLLPLLVNEALRRWDFAIAADLNPEYHPYLAAAVLKSAAIKRIGFRSVHSDYFYNIQMSRQPDDPVESSYRNIYKIILDSSPE